MTKCENCGKEFTNGAKYLCPECEFTAMRTNFPEQSESLKKVLDENGVAVMCYDDYGNEASSNPDFITAAEWETFEKKEAAKREAVLEEVYRVKPTTLYPEHPFDFDSVEEWEKEYGIR